jgi:hypothetical protein
MPPNDDRRDPARIAWLFQTANSLANVRAAKEWRDTNMTPEVGQGLQTSVNDGASADRSGTEFSPQKVLRSPRSPQLGGLASRPVGGEQLDRASDLRFCCFKNAPVLSWSSVHGVFDPSHGDQGPKETVNMGP